MIARAALQDSAPGHVRVALTRRSQLRESWRTRRAARWHSSLRLRSERDHLQQFTEMLALRKRRRPVDPTKNKRSHRSGVGCSQFTFQARDVDDFYRMWPRKISHGLSEKRTGRIVFTSENENYFR